MANKKQKTYDFTKCKTLIDFIALERSYLNKGKEIKKVYVNENLIADLIMDLLNSYSKERIKKIVVGIIKKGCFVNGIKCVIKEDKE